jgi:hypothetical protein
VNLFNDPSYDKVRSHYLALIAAWVDSLGDICDTQTNQVPNHFGSYIALQGENANKTKVTFASDGKLSRLSKCSAYKE